MSENVCNDTTKKSDKSERGGESHWERRLHCNRRNENGCMIQQCRGRRTEVDVAMT